MRRDRSRLNDFPASEPVVSPCRQPEGVNWLTSLANGSEAKPCFTTRFNSWIVFGPDLNLHLSKPSCGLLQLFTAQFTFNGFPMNCPGDQRSQAISPDGFTNSEWNPQPRHWRIGCQTHSKKAPRKSYSTPKVTQQPLFRIPALRFDYSRFHQATASLRAVPRRHHTRGSTSHSPEDTPGKARVHTGRLRQTVRTADR